MDEFWEFCRLNFSHLHRASWNSAQNPITRSLVYERVALCWDMVFFWLKIDVYVHFLRFITGFTPTNILPPRRPLVIIEQFEVFLYRSILSHALPLQMADQVILQCNIWFSKEFKSKPLLLYFQNRRVGGDGLVSWWGIQCGDGSFNRRYYSCIYNNMYTNIETS